MTNFTADMLEKVKSIFPKNSVEILTFRSDDNATTFDSPVKVIHKATQTEVVCDKYNSQQENCAMALITLALKISDNKISSIKK